ncbi:MAG: polysaccharide lyase family 8 super-sandwich domain-containing protein [Dysgonomonas sp.]|nr:polysaccharide lyase family 8 super-sandwich domain-containing protein [Dysgonomonas sp.]
MKKIISSLVILLFAYFVSNANEISTIKRNYKKLILSENKSEQNLISILKKNLKEEFYSDQMVVELMDRYPIQSKEVKALLDNLKADGTWTDINYEDKNRSGWQPKKHVERTLLLTKAYYTKGNKYYQSKELEQIIHKTLGYWLEAKHISLNWWHNQIGVPKIIGAIAILFEEKLTPDEMQGIIEVMNAAKFGMTGQNKVWLAGNVLVKGLLEEDLQLVKSARDTIFSEIKTGSREGIKADNSFHQHGVQLQFGNYGAAYIASMGMWSQVLSGTSLSLQQPQLDILSRLINDGYRHVLWKGYMDINSLGRQFFKQAQLHKAFSVGFTSSLLMDADTKNMTRYQALLNENFLNKSAPNTFTGLYHFWMSDYTVQRRPDWMASVRMSSPRVTGAEAGNGDNLKGYYLADGAMYVYTRGDEYLNIFPCWDWRKIPGVTSYETKTPLKLLDWGGYNNRNSFVGAITDGTTGITAMAFDRDGIRARKAWVFTNDFILCLGAGIEADSGLVVTTSIDQRIKRGNLLHLQDNKWEKVSNIDIAQGKESRFYHDHTGYIVLQPEGGKALTEKRVGKWKEVMNIYPTDYTETRDVMSLWIDHGRNPRNGSYQYFVLPATTSKNVRDFNTNSIKINRNTAQYQSVTVGNTTYIAAYPLANVDVADGIRVASSNTGLFIITVEENRRKVMIVDPTQQQTSMKFSFRGETRIVELPQGELAGTPVTIYFDKKD